MGAKTALSPFRQVSRQHKFLKEQQHDNCMDTDKIQKWIACPSCHEVYQDRREHPRKNPGPAYGRVCPACHQNEDDTAVGFLILHGSYFLAHRAEIKQMILDLEECERNKNSLKRIIDLKESVHLTFITTSDIDFARKIGEALHAKYQGNLELLYNEEKNLIDVDWQC